jgi:NAD(P)-dependent dehydrogenase (short-subunit alcohol dehydrogenase family)
MKTVFISGAGSGLGAALARRYADLGAHVIVADLNIERAQETLASLSGSGHSALQMDVANAIDWEHAVKHVQANYAGLDVLINNAGIASSGDFLDTTQTEWDRVIAINLTSIQLGCKSFLPMLLKKRTSLAEQATRQTSLAEQATRQRCLVINTASFAGLAGAPDTGVYGVTKAAVVAYSEILRGQVFAHGLHVACLCPSFFKTNLLESFAPGHDRMRKAANQLMEQSALNADDVARFAIDQAEKGVFLLLPHPDTRTKWRLKRFLPELYFKKMLKMLKRDKVR